jgi:hypothetical protein
MACGSPLGDVAATNMAEAENTVGAENVTHY